MNLRDVIGSQVRPLKPQNINKAQQEALEDKIWYREKNRSRPNLVNKTTLETLRPPLPSGHAISFNSRPALQNPPNQNMPLNQRLNLQCNFCKNSGHTENQCYQK